MKEVKAIIRPFVLERVIEALRGVQGLPAVTISPANILSVEGGVLDQVAHTKLEVMVPDGLVATVSQIIQQAAHTGNPGDGRIFVIPIEHTVQIRTGEQDTWD